jgi:hypothetical protein
MVLKQVMRRLIIGLLCFLVIEMGACSFGVLLDTLNRVCFTPSLLLYKVHPLVLFLLLCEGLISTYVVKYSPNFI